MTPLDKLLIPPPKAAPVNTAVTFATTSAVPRTPVVSSLADSRLSMSIDSRHVSPVSTRASTLEHSRDTLSSESNVLGSSQTTSAGAQTALAYLKPRNIVICLDGTGNQFSAQNSNVIKLMSVLQADEDQLLYYSSGVGE